MFFVVLSSLSFRNTPVFPPLLLVSHDCINVAGVTWQ